MDVLNPWMLFGLAGIAIPILVHLLSRRKQDLVDWGAMQFLEPSPKERRSLWIENFWLMLLRVGLLAVLAFALARPWFQSSWLARWTITRAQDVALVLDGSYSLEESIGPGSASDRVRGLAREVLAELDSSDALQIYDARETARPLLSGYSRNRAAAREALIDIPVPSGASNLTTALQTAMRDLMQTANLDRDIVVVTDGQRFPWRVDQPEVWASVDQLMQQARVTPRIWVLTSEPPPATSRNLSIGPMEFSQELAMPGAEIRIRAPIRMSGSDAPVGCTVGLEIDGLKTPRHSTTLRVPAVGAAIVEFPVTLDRQGCHALSLRLEFDDALPADNVAHGIVEIGSGREILVVDGGSEPDPRQRESFFFRAALDSGPQSIIRPTVVDTQNWDLEQLDDYAVLVLANIATLNEEQLEAVRSYVESGGSLLVTLGDRSSPSSSEMASPWEDWLGVRLQAIAEDGIDTATATTIVSDSLELPWQERFRHRQSSGLSDVRFGKWWKVEIPEGDDVPTTLVAARFASGDPCLLWSRRGTGSCAIWTSSLDADWNALPSRPDYVAWWHEVLLALMERQQPRNVPVGTPLIAFAPPNAQEWTGQFIDPLGHATRGEPLQIGKRLGARFPSSLWPGLYVFEPTLEERPRTPETVRQLLAKGSQDAYAARPDLGESDLSRLTDEELSLLAKDRPLQFVSHATDLRSAWMGDAGRFELSSWLLYAFLTFLVLEVIMTSRMVRRGTGGPASGDQE